MLHSQFQTIPCQMCCCEGPSGLTTYPERLARLTGTLGGNQWDRRDRPVRRAERAEALARLSGRLPLPLVAPSLAVAAPRLWCRLRWRAGASGKGRSCPCNRSGE